MKYLKKDVTKMGKKRKNRFESLDDILENGTFEQILIWHVINYPKKKSNIEYQRKKVINVLSKRKELIKKDLDSLIKEVSKPIFNLNEYDFHHIKTEYDKLKLIISDNIIDLFFNIAKKEREYKYIKIEFKEENLKLFEKATKIHDYFKNYDNRNNIKLKENPKIDNLLKSYQQKKVDLDVGIIKNNKTIYSLKYRPIFIIKKNFKTPERLSLKLSGLIMNRYIDIQRYKKYILKGNEQSIDTYIWNYHKDELLRKHTLTEARKLVKTKKYQEDMSYYSISIKDLSGLAIVTLEPRDDSKNNLFNKLIVSIKKKDSFKLRKNERTIKITGEIRDYYNNPRNEGYFNYSNAVHFTMVRPRIHPEINNKGQLNFLEIQIHELLPFISYEIGNNDHLSHWNYEIRNNQFDKKLTQKEQKRYYFIKEEIENILKQMTEQ